MLEIQIVLMLDSKLEQENRQIKQKKEENQDNNPDNQSTR